MLATDSYLPAYLIPWLVGALIVLCLVGIAVLLRDMAKKGPNVYHTTMVMAFLGVTILLGIGSAAWSSLVEGLRAAQQNSKDAKDTANSVKKDVDLTRAQVTHTSQLVKLLSPQASAEQLNQVIANASTTQDKNDAIRLYSVGHPAEVASWLNTEKKEVSLKKYPQLHQTFNALAPEVAAHIKENENIQ